MGWCLFPRIRLGWQEETRRVMMLDWSIVQKSKVGKINFRRKA